MGERVREREEIRSEGHPWEQRPGQLPLQKGGGKLGAVRSNRHRPESRRGTSNTASFFSQLKETLQVTFFKKGGRSGEGFPKATGERRGRKICIVEIGPNVFKSANRREKVSTSSNHNGHPSGRSRGRGLWEVLLLGRKKRPAGYFGRVVLSLETSLPVGGKGSCQGRITSLS